MQVLDEYNILAYIHNIALAQLQMTLFLHDRSIKQCIFHMSLLVLNDFICNLFSRTIPFMKHSLISLLSTEVPQHDPNQVLIVAWSSLAQALAWL